MKTGNINAASGPLNIDIDNTFADIPSEGVEQSRGDKFIADAKLNGWAYAV